MDERWRGGAPRLQLVSSRPRSGGVRVINGRTYTVTPAQEARLEITAAQARALVREVQQHDPSWRPRPSIYEGVEGEIRANEADAQQAAARLRQLGAPEPSGRSLADVLRPEGRPIGFRQKGASTEVRTVTAVEFEELLAQLAIGARATVTPSQYQGRWYVRADGSMFGIRRSERYGLTFEIISSNHPEIRPGDKVHKQ